MSPLRSAIACVVALLAGCALSPSQGDRDAEIYAAVISRVAAHRGPPVLVSDRACSGVADTTGTPVDCGPPFTRQERKAIRSRVEESPVIRFVSNPGGIEDRIFRRTGAGTGSLSLVRLGPIFPMGDRVQVEVSSYCGGLCGSWMTLVLERTSGGWEVTGTTGPVAIS